MTITPEIITLKDVLARHGITKGKELLQHAGISKQHAWGLMWATIGVGKVAAKRLHETLGIPTDELLAVAEVPCWEKRQVLAGRTPPRPKARPGRKPQARKARRPVTAMAAAPDVEELGEEFSGDAPNNSGPAPTAQPISPVMLSPQERRAAMLAQLRAMQAAGMTLAAMAAQFNAKGVPTLSGNGRWQKGTIGNLLKEGQA